MKLILLAIVFLSLNGFAAYKAEYPRSPDIKITPGSLCDRPDQYRYPERIPYCSRDVDPSLKDDIFREYRLAGYRLDTTRRSDYKIDHFIPLCAGGSNKEDNLWPQHYTIYELTDPIESLGCQKLKLGLITQANLIKLIISAKRDLRLVKPVLNQLNRL